MVVCFVVRGGKNRKSFDTIPKKLFLTSLSSYQVIDVAFVYKSPATIRQCRQDDSQTKKKLCKNKNKNRAKVKTNYNNKNNNSSNNNSNSNRNINSKDEDEEDNI